MAREIRIFTALEHLRQGALLVRLSTGHYVVGLGRIPDEMAAALLARDDVRPAGDRFGWSAKSPSYRLKPTDVPSKGERPWDK